MSKKLKVLIICEHNSGRSQITETYLNSIYDGYIEVESAGFEPAETVNPLVVEVMKEEGFDLSDKKPQSVFELFKKGRIFDHVVTVCSDGDKKCPIFPGITKRWHVPFPDPSEATGSHKEQLAQVRSIRDMIREWIKGLGSGEFISEMRQLKLESLSLASNL